jgi:thioesterase domain-containing protein
MARVIAQTGSSVSWRSLVPIQADGLRPPFFCIHGLFGNVLCFRELAQCLGPDQPFFGLQAVGLDDISAPHTTVEAMAAQYLEEVRQIQSAGPYFLGGYSFGGMVAFEMAQQLQDQGEEVALLALIDAMAPALHHGIPPFFYTVYLRWRGASPTGIQAERNYALDRLVADGRFGPAAHDWALRSMEYHATYRRVERATTRASRMYIPRAYPGRAVLLRTMGRSSRLAYEPLLGWGPLVMGGLTVHDVPGDHFTVLSRPQVEALARQLRACLDYAQPA